ncbi:MAG: hypothetical protein V1806_02585 [Pseudomonadota bacterium]
MSRALAVLLAASLLAGCSLWRSASPEAKGGTVGGATGAVAGALISGWRGGIIGGVLGVVAGATISHIATRASREAAHNQKPVAYSDDAGTHRVEAYPVASRGRCRTVVQKFYEHGQMVRETQEEVCD